MTDKQDPVALAKRVEKLGEYHPDKQPRDSVWYDRLALARAVLDMHASCGDLNTARALVDGNADRMRAQRDTARAEVEKREATIGVAGLLLTDAMASLEGFLDHIGDCWEWVSRDGELNAGCNEMRRLQRRLKNARAALGEEG